MREKGIGAVPILEWERGIGMPPRTDVLKAFLALEERAL